MTGCQYNESRWEELEEEQGEPSRREEQGEPIGQVGGHVGGAGRDFTCRNWYKYCSLFQIDMHIASNCGKISKNIVFKWPTDYRRGGSQLE